MRGEELPGRHPGPIIGERDQKNLSYITLVPRYKGGVIHQ